MIGSTIEAKRCLVEAMKLLYKAYENVYDLDQKCYIIDAINIIEDNLVTDEDIEKYSK